MRSMIHAELYKLSRYWLVLPCMILVYLGAGLVYGAQDAEIFHFCKGLELFALPAFAWLPLCFAVVLAVGLLIGEDFSRGTIRNALTVGVARRDYYFARMGVQMLVTAAAFLLGQLAYLICRILHPQGNSAREMELLGAKLTVYIFVTLLQLLAYVAVINAVCYFVKKQVAAMVVGMVLVYMEAIIRQLAEAGNIQIILQIVQYMPARVLYRMFHYAVYDQIFTLDFLSYGISALIMIGVSSAVGFVKFEYDLGEC